MTQLTAVPVSTAATTCDPTTRTTKSLLAYGVVAGPVFVLVSLAQALTRDGFDLARHQWSLLANGDLGWIQISNFLVSGLMTIAFAVGLRRALYPGPGTTWAPRLVAVYGASLLAAGVFRADPALGFPAGTPAGPGTVSWHGMVHFMSAGIGFPCLIAACFVLGRRFSSEGARAWARYSRLTAAVFLAGFVAVATGGGAVWSNVAFVVAVILAWSWVSATALHRYHHTAH
jgi:hypothetical protein